MSEPTLSEWMEELRRRIPERVRRLDELPDYQPRRKGPKRKPGRRNVLSNDRSWAPRPKPEPRRLYGQRPEPAPHPNGGEILTPELTRWLLDRHGRTYGWGR